MRCILALNGGNAYAERAGIGDVAVVVEHIGALAEVRDEDVGGEVLDFAIHAASVLIIVGRNLVDGFEASTSLVVEGDVFHIFATLHGEFDAHFVAHLEVTGRSELAFGIVDEDLLCDREVVDPKRTV